MNCQCNSYLHADWVVGDSGRNQPCWRCARCGTFSGYMTTIEAAAYRQRYFAVPKGMRRVWNLSYRRKQ